MGENLADLAVRYIGAADLSRLYTSSPNPILQCWSRSQLYPEHASTRGGECRPEQKSRGFGQCVQGRVL